MVPYDNMDEPFANEDGDQEEITIDSVLKSVTKNYDEVMSTKIKAAASKKDVPEMAKLIKEVIDAEGTKKCHACERVLQLGEQYNSWTADKLLCIACAKKLDLEIAPGDTPLSDPEETVAGSHQPEATLDDLISLLQSGGVQGPADIPEDPKKIKITSDQGDVVEATVTKPFNKDAPPKQQEQNETFKTITTPQKTVKKPLQPIKVTPKTVEKVNTGGRFMIPLPWETGFTDLTVYTHGDTQAKALGEWDILPTKHIFLSYNVAMALVKNGRDEPIRVYFVNGYEDFTAFLLLPGDKVEFGKNLDEKMKHVVQTSAKAPEIDNFTFLKTWMPV